MADPWAVVSQAPASDDPWRVVAQKPQEPKAPSAYERAKQSSDKYNLIKRATDPLVNALGETGLQAASAAGHAVIGGWKGIGDLATGQGLNKAVDDIEAEKAKTYQPKTGAGQLASKALGYVPQKQAQLAQWAGGKATSAATALGASPEVAGGIGATVDTLGNVAGPGMLLKGLRGARGSTSRAVGPPKPNFEDVEIPGYGKVSRGDPAAQADMVKKARAAGYVLKPSEAGGQVGKMAEGLTGSPRLSIEASLRNQPVTDSLAATEINLPKGTKITPGVLRRASAPHNDVYRELSALGDIDLDEHYSRAIAAVGRTPGKSFPKAANQDVANLREQYSDKWMDSADAVHEIKSLRSQSRKNLAAPFAPNQNALGAAQRQVADAIESQLERHAEAIGKTDLVKRFRNAREELAKINSVREALIGNTGHVSASKLAKMQQKGVPLSGNLKLIADVSDEFGEVTRDANKVKNKVPATVLEGAAGGAGIAMSALHHPIAGGATLLGTVARPATRKYLLSESYQNRLAPGPKKRKFTLADLDDK